MKIISKYKDYYDYISGIYGEDPLLVLDRREGYIHRFSSNSENHEEIHKLYICGFIVEIYQKGNKLYCGESLEQFHNVEKSWWYKFYKINRKECCMIIINGYKNNIYKIIRKDEEYLNIKHDCPIMYMENEKKKLFKYFPRLSDFNIISLLPEQEIYNMLSSWYSRKRTDNEQTNTQSNEQKIINKGFDSKKSFRPNMKK